MWVPENKTLCAVVPTRHMLVKIASVPKCFSPGRSSRLAGVAVATLQRRGTMCRNHAPAAWAETKLSDAKYASELAAACEAVTLASKLCQVSSTVPGSASSCALHCTVALPDFKLWCD